jgi:hypothetical protein
VEDENAWALPTTLMPTKLGADWRDFVRIAGHTNDDERTNTCVGPGFACGMNPTLPTGLPPQCRVEKGNWTFVDFDANTAQCPFDFGFYVAFYRETCGADSDCWDAGTDADDPVAPAFGFFEATPYRAGFDAYMADVLALNDGWDYRFDNVNVYNRPGGGRITFDLAAEDDEWPIVDYDAGTGIVTPERKFEKWAIALGDPVSSPIPACIVVENRKLQQKLILDHADVIRPRRAIVKSDSDCGCPLIDVCIGPRAE